MEFLKSLWSFLGNNSSEIIALCAFVIAVWQGYLIRKHNKLSIRPHLNFHTLIQWDEPQVQIYLDNVGIGPAIIKSYKVILDGVELDLLNNKALIDLVESLHIPDKSYGGGQVFMENDAIRQGESITVLGVTTKKEHHDGLNNTQIHKELKRIQISVTYKCLYGKTFSENLHVVNQPA